MDGDPLKKLNWESVNLLFGCVKGLLRKYHLIIISCFCQPPLARSAATLLLTEYLFIDNIKAHSVSFFLYDCNISSLGSGTDVQKKTGEAGLSLHNQQFCSQVMSELCDVKTILQKPHLLNWIFTE